MTTTDTVRIATRESQLALWQAKYVQKALTNAHPHMRFELVPMTTAGDQILHRPLAKIGGKGLFIKELEVAMLEGRADIAVHSMKDVPAQFPDGLGLHAICPRDNPFDAFVSNNYARLDDLPHGAVVGTSSLRRQCQLKKARPDIVVKSLRGNVNTRLAKLDNGDYDVIILAAAGLNRLEFASRIRHTLSPTMCLPAVGQGAVGIECKDDDLALQALLAPLADPATTQCVLAERAMNALLQGSCQVPIAGFATLDGQQITLTGRVGSPDGRLLYSAQAQGEDPTVVGEQVADQLLSQGAGAILAEFRS